VVEKLSISVSIYMRNTVSIEEMRPCSIKYDPIAGRAVATLGSRLGRTGSNGLVLTELRRKDLTDRPNIFPPSALRVAYNHLTPEHGVTGYGLYLRILNS
jgi:hypothetical protein